MQAQNLALTAAPSSAEAPAPNDPSQSSVSKSAANSEQIANTMDSTNNTRSDNSQTGTVALAQNSLMLQNQSNGQMNTGAAPNYDYQQMSTQVNGLAQFNNPFMTQAQPSSFLGASNGFTSTFDFSNDPMSMPFSLNPSTNQADLAFWREMPMGEDAGEWGFFTDQYANTLLSSLPNFAETYNTQL